MISAEGVIPGKPVEEDGRLVLEETKNLGNHLLIAAEHAVSVDDAFGHAGGTGGEEDFCYGVGLDFLVGGIDGGGGRGALEVGERCCWAVRQRRSGDYDFCFLWDDFFEGMGVAFAI